MQGETMELRPIDYLDVVSTAHIPKKRKKEIDKSLKKVLNDLIRISKERKLKICYEKEIQRHKGR